MSSHEFHLPFQWESGGFISPFVPSGVDSLLHLVEFLKNVEIIRKWSVNDGEMAGRVLIDLGCGEGIVLRLLCSAFGFKGFGYDLDEDLINEAIALSPSSDQISFKKLDILSCAIEEIAMVDILFVYLLPDALESLRYRLREIIQLGHLQLIISNTFPMTWLSDGDSEWRFGNLIKVNNYNLYLRNDEIR